jgi:hypothetical protein
MEKGPDARVWVALLTWSDDAAGMSYEAGGVYPDEPRCGWTRGSRELELGEFVALCPRCGQRFAATAESTAKVNRDRHFDGSQDLPSICRQMPARRAGLMHIVKDG